MARARERIFFILLWQLPRLVERSKEPYRRYPLVLSSSELGYVNGVQLAICSNIAYTVFCLLTLETRAPRLGLLPFFPVFRAGTNYRSKRDRS